MSKCVLCGNELLTGDIHWQSGMCNQCWNEHYTIKGAVPLDRFYGDLYLDLLKQYRDLEQENKILKEALKLACGKKGDTFKCPCICEIGDFNHCYNCRYKHYIEQAKESMNGTNNNA